MLNRLTLIDWVLFRKWWREKYPGRDFGAPQGPVSGPLDTRPMSW